MSIMQTYDEVLLTDLAQTLLYEGYSLYPHRASALNNRKSIPFGVVFPRSYASGHINTNGSMRTQCLLHASPDAKIDVSVRFLHLVKVELYRKVNVDFVRTKELTADSNHFTEGWQAIERQVECRALNISGLPEKRHSIHVTFPNAVNAENIFSESGIIGRRIFRVMTAMGRVEVEVSAGGAENLWRITARINNQTQLKNAEDIDSDTAMGQSFVAVHIILKTDKGEFISAQNPPEDYRQAITTCKNSDIWPVLIDRENKVMLSSPVVLYDHPEISPAGKGEVFSRHVNVHPNQGEKQAVHD